MAPVAARTARDEPLTYSAAMDTFEPYLARASARSEFASLRGLRIHLNVWGDEALVTPERPALVMLHGWMDVGASFQFVVDAMAQDRLVIAPDWRGFGLSDSPAADSLLVSRLPGRSRRVARCAAARSGDRPRRPQHGRQHRDDLRRRAPGARAAARQSRGLRHARRAGEAGPRALSEMAGRTQGAASAAQLPERGGRRRAPASGPIPCSAPSAPPGSRPIGRAASAMPTPGRPSGGCSPTPRTSCPTPCSTARTRCSHAGRRSARRCCGSTATRPTSRNGGDIATRSTSSTQRLTVVPRVEKHRLSPAGHMLHHDQPEALAARLSAFLDAPTTRPGSRTPPIENGPALANGAVDPANRAQERGRDATPCRDSDPDSARARRDPACRAAARR